MRFDFNPKEWHHGYTGLLALLIGIYFDNIIFEAGGVFLLLDELSQIFIFGQQNGLVHYLYARTLWKISFIRKLNRFLDNLLK